MTRDDRGPVTFVDMVVALLEYEFPWLATDSQDAASGADTVDQLINLYASLLRQPTARGRYSPSAAPREGLHNDRLATSPGALIVPREKVARRGQSAGRATQPGIANREPKEQLSDRPTTGPYGLYAIQRLSPERTNGHKSYGASAE